MGLPPRVAVTCDVVVWTIRDDSLQILLIRRAHPPFRGRWALPGGFIEESETLEASASRELKEETGVEGVKLEQLRAFGDPGRDPRGRTVTVAYAALTPASGVSIRAGDDAGEARWHRADRIPRLAFDHREMIDLALARLRSSVGRSDAGAEFLPKSFTLPELRRVFEILLGRKLDPRRFGRKMRSIGLLRPGGRGYRFRIRPPGVLDEV